MSGAFRVEIRIREFDDGAEQQSRDLQRGEIHVWTRALDGEISNFAALNELLSEDEQARARRYRFDQHRKEFVVTRATLRLLLGSYGNTPPQNVAFSYSTEGKPSLQDVESDVRFNVSHTAGLAVLAFIREHEIAVDVEKLRPEYEAEKLAKRFFSAKERQSLDGLTGDALNRAFFRCWTRKEAFIKAKGGGLSIPLDQFDVSIEEGRAALLGTRPDPAEASQWVLYDLPIRAGYAAALAVSVSSTKKIFATPSEVAERAES